MHLCEEGADGVVVLALVQQQKASVAGRHVCGHKQVVEPVHGLQQQSLGRQGVSCLPEAARQLDCSSYYAPQRLPAADPSRTFKCSSFEDHMASSTASRDAWSTNWCRYWVCCCESKRPGSVFSADQLFRSAAASAPPHLFWPRKVHLVDGLIPATNYDERQHASRDSCHSLRPCFAAVPANNTRELCRSVCSASPATL